MGNLVYLSQEGEFIYFFQNFKKLLKIYLFFFILGTSKHVNHFKYIKIFVPKVGPKIILALQYMGKKIKGKIKGVRKCVWTDTLLQFLSP